MKKWLIPTVVLWAVTFITHAYHDSNLTWKTLETKHFRFHFHDKEEPIVQEFWSTAEQMHQELTGYLNWVPRDKIDVIFTDEFDISNGFARVIPRNNINIFVSAPDDQNSLEDHNGWIDLVFRHELLHIIHLDKARGVPLGFRKAFGRHPLLIPTSFPNAFQPLWYIEGLAVHKETDHKQGIGRGQSTYFDMLMRMEVMDGVKPLRRINQPISSWPAGIIPYLYGGHYHEFLHQRYGAKSIVDMVEGLSDNIVPYRINSNTVNVFRKDLDGMWAEFTNYLNKKHMAQVEKIEKVGVRGGVRLSDDGYVAGSTVAQGDTVYYSAFNYRSHPALMVSKAGQPARKLRNLNYGARLDLHPQQGLLITQPERCRSVRLYYDIYRVDIDGNNYQRLTHCARYRQAVWSRDGKHIIAAHNELGLNSLHLLDAEGQFIEVLWAGKQNEQIGRMSYSPTSDKVAASVWRKDHGWNLEQFDLSARTWTALTDDQFIQNHPSYTEDGKFIIYSSDEDGVYNAYKLDLDTLERTQLTNVIGGVFCPVLTSTGLFYTGYGINGFYPMYLAEVEETPASTLKTIKPKPVKQDEEKPAIAAKPVDDDSPPFLLADTDTVETTAVSGLPVTDYSPFETLAPTWWLPYLFIDEERTELGIQTIASDALDRHQFATFIAYDVENEWLVGGFDYFYFGFRPILHFGFDRETDLFTDGNDDLVRIRDERQVIAELVMPLNRLHDGWFLHAAAISEREKDLKVRSGVGSLPDLQEDIAAVAARYISAQRYPLSVSRSEGRDVRLIHEDSDVFGNSDANRKGQITVAEWREFIHFGREHVLALRLVEGRGNNNPSPFRLGGVQDDDTLLSVFINGGEASPLFNKREYTLRGYDEGRSELTGKNMRLASAEYRFPIWRIEHGWMTPPFGFNQIYGTAFYDVGGVWNDSGSGPDDYFAGTGFELNADVDLLYNFRIHLALGFATGLDDTLGEEKVYLRIGSQF